MNFRTTTVLLLLLTLVAGYIAYDRLTATPPAARTDDDSRETGKALFATVDTRDVGAFTVTYADSGVLTLTREGTRWVATGVANGPADTFAVDALLRDIVGLRGQSTVGEGVTAALARPDYRVNFKTPTGPLELALSARSAVGDVFARGTLDKNVVTAVVTGELVDKLDTRGRDLLDLRLLDLAANDLRLVELNSPEGNVRLERTGAAWRITQPFDAPADRDAVDDLLYGITGLRATRRLDNPDPAAIARPQLTVSFSTAAPTTGPATAPTTTSAVNTLTFGRFEDVTRQNLYVALGSPPTAAFVPVLSLNGLKKSAWDLRDKAVLNLNAAEIQSIEIDQPAPTTAASTGTATPPTLLTRRLVPVPTTAPSTAPTSSPASAPAMVARWYVNDAPADAAAVEALLDLLRPLRATRFMPPDTTQPTLPVHVRITTPTRVYELDIGPTLGRVDGLLFEANPALHAAATASFDRPAVPVPFIDNP